MKYMIWVKDLEDIHASGWLEEMTEEGPVIAMERHHGYEYAMWFDSYAEVKDMTRGLRQTFYKDKTKYQLGIYRFDWEEVEID